MFQAWVPSTKKTWWEKKNIKNTQIDPGNALIKKGCLPLTKRFQEILLERKRNTTCRVLPVKNFREQRNFWKGSPVFPDGMFWTKFISQLFIPVLGFRGHLSVKLICAMVNVIPELLVVGFSRRRRLGISNALIVLLFLESMDLRSHNLWDYSRN